MFDPRVQVAVRHTFTDHGVYFLGGVPNDYRVVRRPRDRHGSLRHRCGGHRNQKRQNGSTAGSHHA